MAKSTTSKASKSVKKEAAPVASKAAAPKAAAPKAAPAPKAKVAVAAAPVTVKPKAVEKAPSRKTISAQDRYHMIDEAAYYRAEKSGFQVDPHANWIAAEQEINELLAKQNIKVG